MGKNILEKLLAEYYQNTDGILKKYGERWTRRNCEGIPVYNRYGEIEEWFKAVMITEKYE